MRKGHDSRGWERIRLELIEADIEQGFGLVDLAGAAGDAGEAGRIVADADRVYLDIQQRLTSLGPEGSAPFVLLVAELRRSIEQARARFAGASALKGIELLVEVQGPLPRLQVDQGQLDRVLDNLIDNALRHTAEGGLIRLQARRHGERVIISVEDNGEGIAYGQQGRIFEPFVQVGRKKGGAGLGLALCKEIVQLHGGRMGVYSRPGQGTQFYMALAV